MVNGWLLSSWASESRARSQLRRSSGVGAAAAVSAGAGGAAVPTGSLRTPRTS